MSAPDHELKKELDATLQTRRELGPEYEDELLDSFLEKVEQRLDNVVDKRVRRQMAEQQMVVARGNSTGVQQQTPHTYPDGLGARLGLAVASLVLAIPLTAIAVANAGLTGLVTCWAGIVAVNGFQASRSWFSRDSAGEDPRRG
ncbi:hypothetical protein KBZ21_10760 [Streptomyces sp. A73]|uniref:hypothetical protein n=1 Tax=Streptomyces TaxID=1883 RepID=UPI000C18E622|nr:MULTISPECIES: hypothetical protein [unclassified Streptomyces]MBQ0866498.1 hypothetical protein [Streptomyces sp. RK75]MBQ1118916.1 hypothetical protein [Streptomyces sp. B15]MBQ1158614.1 hypothetical protein [Streptomyces sp. A73]